MPEPLNPTPAPASPATPPPAQPAPSSPPVSTPAPTPTPAPAPASAAGQPGASGAAVPSAGNTVGGTAPASAGFDAASSPATAAGQAQQHNEWQQRYEALQRQYQQYQPLIQYGYQAHQSGWKPGQSQPQAPQAAKPAEPENPFGIPQFDRGLMKFIGKDEAGNLTLLPGAPPDTLHRYQEYQERVADFMPSFLTNPGKFLLPMIQKEAEKIADARIERQFGQRETVQASQGILDRHSNWLFDRDAQGNVARDFNPMTGQSAERLSQVGKVYFQLIDQANAAGITDPRVKDQYATAHLENMLLRQRLAAQQAPAQGQQQAQQFLNGAAATPAAQPAPVVPNVVAPAHQPGMTLEQVLRRAMESNGITDEVLDQQMRYPTRAVGA